MWRGELGWCKVMRGSREVEEGGKLCGKRSSEHSVV
jgi:hypothetical protein